MTGSRSQSLLIACFALAIFTSAALLFSVQPMVSKMLLPLLGGTASVWSTCMLFFQLMLLGGYLYVYLLTRWLPVRRQIVLHLALLAAAGLTLPVALPAAWSPPVEGTPVPWLLAVLALAVGAPFFMLSSTAPLLQAWFGTSRHPSARDPYFLYAASNLGSMVALLGYVLVVEPHLRLVEQRALWSQGYGVLIAMIATSALAIWRAVGSDGAGAGDEPAAAAAPPSAGELSAHVTMGRRLWWILLAFVPSSLLLGVTAYITTDVAAVPLLWVVPLALYLLTFVNAFARRPWIPRGVAVLALPILVVPLGVLMFWRMMLPGWLGLVYHLAVFFAAALVCHGELAGRRPAVSRLSEFYLWVAVGGMLGGVFNVLIAPGIFHTLLEYPLVLALACALLPSRVPGTSRRDRVLDLALPAVLALLLLAAGPLSRIEGFAFKSPALVAASVVIALLCFSFRLRRARFGMGMGVLLLAGVFLQGTEGRLLLQKRSFYGVYTVRHRAGAEGGYHVFMHGTTLHGAQSLDPARRDEPLSYYHREGPLGQVFATFAPTLAGEPLAIVGLGTGTIACLGAPGQRITYYEIDPLVERIARDTSYFTLLRDCAPGGGVVLGDARRSLARAADRHYGLIVLDAFSSDAIPVHLMTREALSLYLAKLREGGVVAFHLSNRYLELRPVLAELARDAGLAGVIRTDPKMTREEMAALKTPSIWAVVARRPEDLGSLPADPRWRPLGEMARTEVWTDDFSNVLGAFRWR